MAKRVQAAVPTLPDGARLVVPVLGPGAGGSGRSTVAGLLASAMAAAGPAVVLDLAPRLVSPWPSWSADPGSGLASIPPDRPLRRSEVVAAAARFRAPGEAVWHVLTDHEDWAAPPLGLPSEPGAWYQLAAIGGWRAVVADTAHPLTHDIVTARSVRASGTTAAWSSLPYAVPVLCAAATGAGVYALQQAVHAMEAEGLPLKRLIVALVDQAGDRQPPVVRAAATMLAPRVADLVQVPYDSALRATGLRETGRLRPRTLQAADALARAVLQSAQTAWGTPLGVTEQPAPYYRSPEQTHH
ncbi:hypothetical protein [Streptomyces sp. NPDC097610]|uniref:hypothetical protein n=1 Tax=Streptomyces sp. NPDC097610 TaxID=3157227 RepID=UPI0033205FB1